MTLACVLPWWPTTPLLLVALLAMIVLCSLDRRRWLATLRRTRWLLLFMLLIYALTPHGRVLPGLTFISLDGSIQGLSQVSRLLLMLAALHLLWRNEASALLAAFFCALRPLDWLGGDRLRVASRLYLALHYAQRANAAEIWRQLQQGRLVPLQGGEEDTLQLPILRANWQGDALTLLLVFTLFLPVLAS